MTPFGGYRVTAGLATLAILLCGLGAAGRPHRSGRGRRRRRLRLARDESEVGRSFRRGLRPGRQPVRRRDDRQSPPKIDAKGVLTTVAGTGTKGDGGDGGPAAKAEFNGPHSLAVAPDGSVYLADTWNNRVRKIDPKTGVDHQRSPAPARRASAATAGRRPRPSSAASTASPSTPRASGCTSPTSTTAASAPST